jgi:16S rRNA (cytosine967-C5)-methyltransferase
VEVHDAAAPYAEEMRGAFDRVICDAPCSGWGVIRRKPEIRYKPIEDALQLPELQYAILCRSAELVRKGGVLQYSTCTLNPRENADVVFKFLEANPDFETVDFTLGSLKSENGILTLWPHIHNTDGFFISKLRKNK